MTHDKHTPTTQTEAPTIALLSSQYEHAVTAATPSPSTPAPKTRNLSVRMAKLLPGLRGVLADLEEAYHDGTDRKEILQTQMQLLDALFIYHMESATGSYSDMFIPLILRLQQHCRKTAQVLAVMDMYDARNLVTQSAQRQKEITE